MHGVGKKVIEIWANLTSDKGYINAKFWLDKIYDQTTEFKVKYPGYQKWDGVYGEFNWAVSR